MTLDDFHEVLDRPVAATPDVVLPPCGMALFGALAMVVGLEGVALMNLDGRILAAVLAAGSAGHLLLAVWQWSSGRSFAAIVSAAHGIFWMSLIALVALPKIDVGHLPQGHALSAYLAFWGFFNALLFGSAPRGRAGVRTFFALASGFCFCTALAAVADGAIAGGAATICGLGAIFAGWREACVDVTRGGN